MASNNPEFMRCHICGGKMYPRTQNSSYMIRDRETEKMVTMTIAVTGYACEDCDEIVYTSEEAKRIEAILTSRSA